MNLSSRNRRWAATLMLGVTAAAFVVPAAEAGNAFGHYRRWKNVPAYGYSAQPAFPVQRVYYQRSSSGAAPFIAGLIGGAILGTALSHSHAAASCTYVDPYSGVGYRSLDGYLDDTRGCDHPQVVRVIEDGRCTRQMCWTHDGGWQDYRGGFQGSVGFSYRNDGGRYDGGARWNDDGRNWNRGDDRRWNGRGDDRRWNDRRNDRNDGRYWNDQRDDGSDQRDLQDDDGDDDSR